MSKKRGGQKRPQEPRLPDKEIDKDTALPNKWELRHFVLAVVSLLVGALIAVATIHIARLQD